MKTFEYPKKQLKIVIEEDEGLYALGVGYRYDQVFKDYEKLKNRVLELIDRKFKETGRFRLRSK